MWWKSVEPLSRNYHPNLNQNEYVYAISCRPEVADDVISGENVKAVLNFEAASINSYRENQNHPFA